MLLEVKRSNSFVQMKKPRVNRTKDEMYPIVEGEKDSNKSPQEYAESQGMHYDTYRYWVEKYKKEQKGVKKVVPNFIPIQVKRQKSIKRQTLIIEYPNGVKVHLDSVLGIKQLSELIKIGTCLE